MIVSLGGLSQEFKDSRDCVMLLESFPPTYFVLLSDLVTTFISRRDTFLGTQTLEGSTNFKDLHFFIRKHSLNRSNFHDII